MSEASSSADGSVYSLEDAGISERERNNILWDLDRIDGVAYAEPSGEGSALIYIGLENGVPFDSDDGPNPLDGETSADNFDPDAVREELLELEHRDGVVCEPSRMYMHEDTVEYAVPLGHDESDFYGVPMSRRGNITISARASTRDRVNAFLRYIADHRDVTPEDVPDLVEEIVETIAYAEPSRTREAISEFFGFEDMPYDNIRDAPEEVQAEYWRKMAEISKLHAEAADLIEDVDPERASDHRQTKLLDYDAYLQGVPKEWFNEGQ